MCEGACSHSLFNLPVTIKYYFRAFKHPFDDSFHRLRSTVHKLEKDLMSITRQQNGGILPKPPPRDRDEENLVKNMFEQNAKLKSQISSVTEKNKVCIQLFINSGNH